MTTRLQRRFGIVTEQPGERKVDDEMRELTRETPAPKKGSGKGDPYPTLPRRSLVREKRMGE